MIAWVYWEKKEIAVSFINYNVITELEIILQIILMKQK